MSPSSTALNRRASSYRTKDLERCFSLAHQRTRYLTTPRVCSRFSTVAMTLHRSGRPSVGSPESAFDLRQLTFSAHSNEGNNSESRSVYQFDKGDQMWYDRGIPKRRG